MCSLAMLPECGRNPSHMNDLHAIVSLYMAVTKVVQIVVCGMSVMITIVILDPRFALIGNFMK